MGDREWGAGPRKVLLLHGFSGGPSDLRFLGETFAAQGFHCLAPELPGHRPPWWELRHTTAADWLAAAAGALRSLQGGGAEPVRVIGFSLGGALALRLAAAAPKEVESLVLLAPALELRGSSRLYRALFRWRLLSALVPSVSKGESDLSNEGALPIHRQAGRLPTRGATLLDTLVRQGRASLTDVSCPTLVLWGAGDRVVPRAAAEAAAAGVGSGPAPLLVFPSSGHHLALDVDREEVVAAILRFWRGGEVQMGQEAEP